MRIQKFFFFVAALVVAASCSKDVAQKTQGIAAAKLSSPKFNVTVSTIAGKLDDHGNAEDGNGNKARFWNPTKMIYDYRNNLLYIADGTVIRSMDAQNNVKTYTPLGAIGSSYNEIRDIDLAPGAAGTLYVITKENDLWKIIPSGKNGMAKNIVNRIYSGNKTGALNSGDHFDQATGLATGKNGKIYFFNEAWNTMHRITLTGTTGTVDTFAGKPLTQSGGNGNPYPFKNGKGQNATFGSRVSDIASDSAGNIYVADLDNDLVRKVTPAANVTALFKYANRIGVDIDGPVSTAQSNNVTQVTVNRNGSYVFFTSYGNAGNNLSSFRLIRPGNDVTTLVGNGLSYGDGNGNTAGIAEVGGIASTPNGKIIYLSEPGRKVIRKIVVQ